MDALISLAADRRASRRYLTSNEGVIVIPIENRRLRVSVVDMSANGARIRASEQVSIPVEFDFLVDAQSVIFRAVVRWRRGDNIGVEFRGEARPLSK